MIPLPRVLNFLPAVSKLAVLMGCSLIVLPSFAQQSLQTLLVGVDRRAVTSLDGDWHNLVDVPPAGALYTGNSQINDHGYAMNTHPNLVGKHNQEYDFATAPTIKVPGDWNTQVPQLFNFEGVLWYQRDFDAQPRPGTRTFLHIGAANYRSHVWVNQKRVCDHEGGYPHDERMERTADRAGILIWSEIPDWQRISFDKPEVYAKALGMLREMIRRDRNKASVILWSVSNETGNNPTRTKFLSDLVAEAHRLDGTRLITSALNAARVNGNERIQDDPLCNVLDVIGQNEYVGWYESTPEEADKIHWTFPDKPVLMSEFGAEAKFGNHGPVDQRWTEEQQVYVLQHQFKMLNRIPQLRGTVPWILMDFRSPGRNIPQLQDGYNRKGLISEKGEKKQAFSLIQKVYAEHSIGKAE